ncbi:MAG: hypothetical protein ACM3SP_23460 [Chloroflexota bacterium]
MTEEITFDTDGKSISLLQPDMVLPHQYFATVRTKRLEPEKKLMLAVLEDAVACFQSYVFQRTRRETTLFRETEDWVCVKDSDYLFSLENICAALNLDPGCVREGLLRWKKRMLAEHQKVQPINLASPAHSRMQAAKHGDSRDSKRSKSPYREKRIARWG